MIAYSRGSQLLAGAASLKHRMPAVGAAFGTIGYSSMAEQQLDTLSVAGSNPALHPTHC